MAERYSNSDNNLENGRQPGNRPTNTVNKSERELREQLLLDTALACFDTDQWENVSVAAIAAQAGVAKGTVYLHFTSKHEIYARLALQFYDDLLAKCQTITGKDSRTRLSTLIATVFTYYQQRTEYRRITQYCQREDFINNLNLELKLCLMHAEEQFKQELTSILIDGTKDGSWGTEAINKMHGIYYTLKGAVNHYCCDKNTKQERQIDSTITITNYILSSVGPRIKTTIKTTDSSNKKEQKDTSTSTLDVALEI